MALRAFHALENFRRLLANILLVGVAAGAATPAQAIVNTNSPGNWDGSGIAGLDGEAKLTLTQSGGGTGSCSGSLLAGGQYIITAAHCVSGGVNAISASFLSGTITASATQYFVNPGWTGDLTKGNDLAIIKLNSVVTAVNGYSLYTQAVSPTARILLAGYGYIGTGSAGYTPGSIQNSVHFGYNQFDASASDYAQLGLSTSVLPYDFDNGTAAANVFGSTGLPNNEEATIAPGDSGGGSFIDVNGVLELVGSHDFIGCLPNGCTINSSFGQIGGDVSLAANLAWINSIEAAPEPGAYVLSGIGFAALALLRRQRRALVPFAGLRSRA